MLKFHTVTLNIHFPKSDYPIENMNFASTNEMNLTYDFSI